MPLVRAVGALAAAITLSVNPLTASAETPSSVASKVPGRTLVVGIYGLTADASGKIVVKGPNKYRTVLRGSGVKRLTELAPGTYRLTSKPVTAAGRKAKAHPTRRSVVVKAREGARIVFTYVVPGSS